MPPEPVRKVRSGNRYRDDVTIEEEAADPICTY